MGRARGDRERVAPTFIYTPGTAERLDDPDYRSAVVDRIPMGRVGAIADVAGAVVYLASDAAGMVNGAILAVTGLDRTVTGNDPYRAELPERAEVLIVGAGLAGLAAARQLHRPVVMSSFWRRQMVWAAVSAPISSTATSSTAASRWC